MNLSGFCSADQGTCGVQPGQAQGYPPPPPSGSGTPTYAQLANSPYRSVAQSLFQKVTAALWNVAAAVGREVVCPLLPFLGQSLGASIGVGVDIAEISITGPGGVVLAVSVEEACRAIGKHAGLELQRQLCS